MTGSLVSYLGTNALNYSPYHSYNLDNMDDYGYSNCGYTSYNAMGNYGSVWNGAFTSNSIAQNEQMYTQQMESNLRMQEIQMENNLKMQQKQKEFNAQANAPERALNAKIGELQAVIISNNQDQVMTKYNEALAKVKENYPEMADDEARAYLQEYYTSATGSNLTQDVKTNGSNDFITGLKHGLFFGLGKFFTNKTSADQNVRDLNHVETTTAEKAAKKAGGAVGGLATGAAAGALVGSIFPGIGTAVGALVGGVAGLVCGLIAG